MKKAMRKVNDDINVLIVKSSIRARIILKKSLVIRDERGEFGIGSIISVAIGLIVGAFVLIPGARVFATTVLDDMKSWWGTNIKSTLFPIN